MLILRREITQLCAKSKISICKMAFRAYDCENNIGLFAKNYMKIWSENIIFCNFAFRIVKTLLT